MSEDNLHIDILDKVKPILSIGLDALRVNKDKSAASIAALPACFEYGIIGTKAYAKPDVKAVREYFKYLHSIWIS